MRFSWKALILAPLLVPLVCSVVMLPLMNEGGSAPLLFLVLLVSSSIVSYGTTVFLFLPSLFLLSRFQPTGLKACLLGLVLGAVAFVLLTLQMWKGSGPDSGPPIENFVVFFLRWSADPLTAVFPVAGLVTAGLYWWLATLDRDPPLPDFARPPVP